MSITSISNIEGSNRYKFEKELGTGAFGTVYKATDLQTNQTIAVKVIHKIKGSYMDNPEYLTFKYLIKDTANRLNKDIKDINKPLCHPNIVCYYNVFEENGKIYVVMEYVEGMDLFDWLKSMVNENLKSDVIVNIIRQIAEGLNYLHSIGIIHRDIKLENVLVSNNNTIKITDYGLSCFKDITDSCRSNAGSLNYASPQLWNKTLINSPDEQTLQQIAKSNDVWALGVIAFILTNKQFPFYGNTLLEIGTQVVNKKPKSTYKGSRYDIYSDSFINRLTNAMLNKNYKYRPGLDSIIKAIDNSRRYFYNNVPFNRISWISTLKGLGYQVSDNATTSELESYVNQILTCNLNNHNITLINVKYLAQGLGIIYSKLQPEYACQQLRKLYNERLNIEVRERLLGSIMDMLNKSSNTKLENYLLAVAKFDQSLLGQEDLNSLITYLEQTQIPDYQTKIETIKRVQQLL